MLTSSGNVSSVPVAALGKLLKGRILLPFIKEGMNHDEVEQRRGYAILSSGDAFGTDALYDGYGVLVFYHHGGPDGQRQDEARVRGYQWTAFGVSWVYRDFWKK